MVLPDIFGLWPGAAVEGLRTEDRVFIWQSRPDTGVVGLGEIDHVLPTADGLPKDCFVRYLTRGFTPHVLRTYLEAAGVSVRLPRPDTDFEVVPLDVQSATSFYRTITMINPVVAGTWPDLLEAPPPANPDDLDLSRVRDELSGALT